MTTRTLDQCFHRGDLEALASTFREEGRGLGFSIGGWHPFQINTYLPTLKKLDPLANTSLGKAVWKPIEKVNQTVNKDFAKGKVWSQDHRKQLQIAAAIALAAVGGAYAMGYIGAEGAGAAAAGEAAGEAVGTSAVMTSETLVPLVPGSSAASVAASEGLSLTPGVTPAFSALTGAPVAASVTSGSSILGTAGSVASSLSPLLALGRLLGLTPQPQAAQQGGYGYDSGGNSGGSSGGYGSSNGGGSLGPGSTDGMTPADQVGTSTHGWIVPVGLGALAFYLLTE